MIILDVIIKSVFWYLLTHKIRTGPEAFKGPIGKLICSDVWTLGIGKPEDIHIACPEFPNLSAEKVAELSTDHALLYKLLKGITLLGKYNFVSTYLYVICTVYILCTTRKRCCSEQGHNLVHMTTIYFTENFKYTYELLK